MRGQLSSPLIDLANWAPPGDAPSRAPEREQLAALNLDLDLELKIGRLVLPGGRLLQAGSGRLMLERGKLSAKALQAHLRRRQSGDRRQHRRPAAGRRNRS